MSVKIKKMQENKKVGGAIGNIVEVGKF